MRTIIPSTFPGFTAGATFDQLARDMDRLFDAMATRPSLMTNAASSRVWPSMNVWRDADNIFAEAEIPGFRMEDIEVLATEQTLTLRGRRELSTPDNATPMRLERSVSEFERTLRLPVEIDPDHVQASLTNGVLRVSMPIAEAARPKRVQIQTLEATPGREALTAAAPEPQEATS